MSEAPVRLADDWQQYTTDSGRTAWFSPSLDEHRYQKRRPEGRERQGVRPIPAKPTGGGGTGRGAGRGKGRSALARLTGKLAGLTGYVSEHMPCSPGFNHAVAWGLQSVPFEIHEFLAGEGCKIVVSDLVVSVDPSLRGQRPRGYPVGTTWEMVGACFDRDTKRAIVAESMLRSGSLRPVPYVEAAVREELGHAVDLSLGNPSQNDPQFIQAYQQELAAIQDPDEQQFLQYLLQPNGAGAEETFAQLFALMYGGGAGVPEFRQLVEQRFRQTMQALQAIVPASH